MLDCPQVNRDAPGAQIVDSENTADDISAHTVKDQHLPYRLSLVVYYGCRLRYSSVITSILQRVLRDLLIEVQDLLDRSFWLSESGMLLGVFRDTHRSDGPGGTAPLKSYLERNLSDQNAVHDGVFIGCYWRDRGRKPAALRVREVMEP